MNWNNFWEMKVLGAGLLFDAEAGGGSGAGTNGADAGQQGAGSNAEAGGSSDEAEIPDWAKDPKRAVEAKRKVDAEAKQHREEKEAAIKREKDLQTQLDKLQKEALKKQGDYQALYEASQTELETLKAEKVTFERYQQAFQAMFEAQMKVVPAHIQELLKGRDPLEALQWLQSNADKLKPPAEPDLDSGRRGGSNNRDYLGSEQHKKDVARRLRLR